MVAGFPRYEISSMGRLRRLQGRGCRRARVLRACLHPRHGYLHYNLSRDGKSYFKQAHRLVAEAFLPKPDKPELAEVVNHRNRNPTDNRASNLEWCSRRENSLHFWRMKRDLDLGLAA